MWIFSAISAVLSLVQGLQQAKAEKKLAEQQAQLAREAQGIAEANARRVEAETLESTRRQDMQHKMEEGKARAYAAASGFAAEDTGSIALSLYAQKSENQKQLAYAREAGASQAAIQRLQGQYALNQGMAQSEASRERAKASIWGGVARAAGSIASIDFGKIGGGDGKERAGSSIFSQPPAPVEERKIKYL